MACPFYAFALDILNMWKSFAALFRQWPFNWMYGCTAGRPLSMYAVIQSATASVGCIVIMSVELMS